MASRGFSDDAARYAKASGILTYTLVDAASVKWREQAMLPISIVYVSPVEFNVSFVEPGTLQPVNVESGFTGLDSGDLYLRSNDNGTLTTAATLAQRKWDELAAARVPYSGLAEYIEGFRLISDAGATKDVTIKFTRCPYT